MLTRTASVVARNLCSAGLCRSARRLWHTACLPPVVSMPSATMMQGSPMWTLSTYLETRASRDLTNRPAVTLFLREPTERRSRIDHRQRRVRVPIRIACHQGVAAAGFGSRRADGILEIRPGQRECPSDDGVINRSDGEDANETFHALAGERRVTSLLEEVENRRDAVGGDHAVGLSAFDRRPQRGRDISAGRTVENDVEEDVQVKQKALHRYFRLRCLRCASAGTPRAAPRSIRRTGVWSSALGGFDRRSR